MLRKKLLILIVLFASVSRLDSQVLIGSVTDAEHNPIGFAQVEDTLTRKKTSCNFSGNFVLTLNGQTILKITHPEYESKNFPISPSKKSDTLLLNFLLPEKRQLVSEVSVTSDRLKKVTDQENVHVVDYLPFKDFILTIKTSKSRRLLGIEGVDTTLQEFDLGKIRARSLFEDCFGNVHLLTKDSSYQIWIDSSLHIVSTSSIETFNKLLKPCVANFPENNLFYTFSQHNRKYTLTAVDRQTKQKNHFFHVYDTLGAKVAQSHYQSIISAYHERIPDYANMIALGVWNGDLMTLNFYNPEITWYLKIRAAPLTIQAFQTDNGLVVPDQFSDSIHVFNDQLMLLKKVPYSFRKGSTVFPTIQDRYTHFIYELSKSNGVYTITAIDPALDHRISPRQLILSEVPSARNIQLFNDRVFFLVEENGFSGLYRIKMPEGTDQKPTD